jgi:F-type H+-transporting ATPase subunit delta
MKEVIAKRYVKALKLSSSIEELESFYKILDSISISLLEPKFADIINSPEVSKEVKVNLILDSMSNVDEKLKNFMRVIGEYKRFDILPEVTKELRYQLALTKNKFEGKVFTSKELTDVQINELMKSFNQKLSTEIVLTQEIGNFNGIKVEIDDLGVEIGFSKDRLQNQIIEHILKAI